MSMDKNEGKFDKSSEPMTDVMNRREVLKRLGFGSLAIIGSGTLVSTLQGCTT